MPNQNGAIPLLLWQQPPLPPVGIHHSPTSFSLMLILGILDGFTSASEKEYGFGGDIDVLVPSLQGWLSKRRLRTTSH